MLDVVYYPVSFVLWCWHQGLALVFGDAAALGWLLAVVLLVVTLRAALLKPALGQARALRRMTQLAPRMTELRKRYGSDRERYGAELQKLLRAEDVRPGAAYLPMLLQLPVFLGLGHVLRAFTSAPHAANYVFSAADVHSYLAAKLFGAHLGDAMVNVPLLGGGAHLLWMWQIAPVAVPLIVLAAVATHLTARLASVPGQPAAMRLLGRYGGPLLVLVSGVVLPLGLLVYWLTNNACTLAQQALIARTTRPAE
ncbi:MAG TPA: membrane protein insertase YidC [Streptosporangiales bacterium]